MKKCFAIMGLSLLLFACDSGDSASALRDDASVSDTGNIPLSAEVDEITQITDVDEQNPYGEPEGVLPVVLEKPAIKSSSSVQISSSSEESKLKKLNVVDFVPEGEWYITYEAKEAVTWTCGKN